LITTIGYFVDVCSIVSLTHDLRKRISCYVMTAAGFCSDQQHEKVVLERCVFLSSSTHFVVL